MPLDLRSLYIALVINLLTAAVALPAVMGRVGGAARRAQWACALQASGWVLIIASGLVERDGPVDRMLATASMASMAASLALLGGAFERWCGRTRHARLPVLIAAAMPLGYALGFSSYPFRVAWANGLLALQMLMIAATVAGRTPHAVGRWRWLMVLSLLAQAGGTAWRGVLGGFFTAQYPNFLAPHPVNVAAAVTTNVTALLTLLGVLLAHRDEAKRALERLATFDDLTGVLNRRAWMARGREMLAASRRYAQPLALLMIDLDHFKRINDTQGHAAGDRALQLLARELAAVARVGDAIGRHGGEEFCVLMAHADADAVGALDRRLRERLAEAAPRELGFALGFSAGIALRGDADPDGDGPDTLEAMLRRADAALYRAKDAGRARTLGDEREIAPPVAALPQPA